MKKYFVFFFLLCFSVKGFSQQTLFSAQIIDFESEEPVYGAYISINDSITTSTDDEGLFRILLLSSKNIRSICISHIAYETICFKNTSEIPKKISMQPQVEVLSEVVVYSKKEEDTDIRSFIKGLKRVYKKTSDDYLVLGFNIKSFTTEPVNDRKYKTYIETEGKVIIPGARNLELFNYKIWNYCQARVIENPYSVEREFKEERGYYPIVEEYRVFQANHPLSKKSRNYSFKIEPSEYINNKKYWVISYYSKRKIKNNGRYVSNVRGKIWIDPDTYLISKEIYGYDFESIYSSQGSLFYTQIDGYNVVNKVMVKFASKIDDTTNSSILNFYIPQSHQKYTSLNIDNFFDCYEAINYDEKYWSDKPISKNNPFYKELNIIKGNQTFQQAFDNSKNSKVYSMIKIVNSMSKEKIEKIEKSR